MKKNILLSSIAALSILSIASNAQELESVNVWETEVVSSSVNLGKNAIETKQADHLSDLLRDIPGVDVGGTHSINNRINIRGLQDEDLDITLDGAKVQNANMFHHIGNLLINPDILKKASIQVGTNSVVNGSLGGSVAFETKTGEEMLENGDDFGARLSTTYNSNASIGGSIAAYGKIMEQANFLIYHNYRHNKDTKDAEGTKGFGSDGKVNNTLLKFGVNLSDTQSLSLSYDRLKDKGDYYPRPDFGYAYNNAKTGTYTYPTVYTRNTITLKHKLNLGSSFLLDTTFYSNENELERFEYAGGAGVRPGKTQGLLNGKVKTIGLNTKAQSNIQTGDLLHTLSYGVLYDKQTSKVTWDGDKYGEDEEAKSINVFVQNAIDFNNGLLLTPGIRFNHYDFDGTYGKIKDNKFTYGLASEYTVNDNFTLLASATTLYKGVEMVDVLATNRLSASATNSAGIKAETGINKEIGFKYIKDNVLGANNIGFSFKYFNTTVKDYIKNEWGPGYAYNYMTNAGDLDIKGFEANFAFNLENLNTLLSYSKSDTKLKDTNEPLEKDQGDMVSLSLDYQINSNIDISWNSLFVRTQNDIPSGAAHEKASYNVHDIAVKWNPNIKGLSLIAGVDNIFDKTYTSHTSINRLYTLNSAQVVTNDYEPGRNIKITLAYKF